MTIPVFRIFDYDKAIEFYVDYLGFKVDWEHVFHENAPIYLQVSRGSITLHLTEHHGDCSPGGKAFIEFVGLTDYHAELKGKHYKYLNPGISKAPWNANCMELTDPFGNKLLFNESEN